MPSGFCCTDKIPLYSCHFAPPCFQNVMTALLVLSNKKEAREPLLNFYYNLILLSAWDRLFAHNRFDFAHNNFN